MEHSNLPRNGCWGFYFGQSFIESDSHYKNYCSVLTHLSIDLAESHIFDSVQKQAKSQSTANKSFNRYSLHVIWYFKTVVSPLHSPFSISETPVCDRNCVDWLSSFAATCTDLHERLSSPHLHYYVAANGIETVQQLGDFQRTNAFVDRVPNVLVYWIHPSAGDKVLFWKNFVVYALLQRSSEFDGTGFWNLE